MGMEKYILTNIIISENKIQNLITRQTISYLSKKWHSLPPYTMLFSSEHPHSPSQFLPVLLCLNDYLIPSWMAFGKMPTEENFGNTSSQRFLQRKARRSKHIQY